MILFPYTDGRRQVDPDVMLPGCEVMKVNCVTAETYEKAFQVLWTGLPFSESLIVLEHDVQVNLNMYQNLIDCPHGLCAQRYMLYPVTTGLQYPVCAHRKIVGDHITWVEEDDEWADFVGFGFVKIDSRPCFLDLPKGTWRNLDSRVSNITRVEGEKWHLHRPDAVHLHQ